jgi:glycosyltransferase involved in cell wall biosynthesis
VDALLCVSPEGNDVSAWFGTPPDAEYCTCNPLMLSHLIHKPDRKLAACLIGFAPDVIFMPVERYIRFNGVPVVNMVRNMEPFMPSRKGDPTLERFKRVIQRKLTYNSIMCANRTIAVSAFVKDYLISELHIPANKVSQIYHGIDHQPNAGCRRPPTIPIGWDDNFLFTCGSIRPARGLEDVIEALGELRAQKPELNLVIAGQTVQGMRRYRQHLEKIIASTGLAESVCWAGHLSDSEVNWCFDNCRTFVMSSRIEACPNIALEAMAHGAVSIAADNPPLPEFFSECAVYYEAGNARSLAEGIINRMALNSYEHMGISQQSRKRSSIFSWDLTAELTVTILAQVMRQPNFHNGS